MSVLTEPGEEISPFGGLFDGALGRGQALGVLLQAFDAEDFGTDRLFHLRKSGDDSVGGVHFELPFRDFARAPRVQLTCTELWTATVPFLYQVRPL